MITIIVQTGPVFEPAELETHYEWYFYFLDLTCYKISFAPTQ